MIAKQFWHVMRFDVARRALLLLYLSLTMPLLVLLQGRPSVDKGLGAAIAAGLVTALVLGAGLFTTDLVEGRLGFFLARPLGAAPFLAGKLSAALLVSLATVLLMALPNALLAGDAARELPRLALYGAPVLLALLLVGHGVALAARSRSSWRLCDVAAVVATIWGLVLALRWLRVEGLNNVHLFFIPPFLGLLVGGTFAGFLQLRHGGTDPKRSHGWWSAAMAGALLAGTAGSLVMARAALRVEVGQLAPGRTAASAGDWLALVSEVSGGGRQVDPALRSLASLFGGPGRDASPASGDDTRAGLRAGYRPSFLVHLPSRSTKRLARASGPAAIAQGGGRAAWLARHHEGGLELVWSSLPETGGPLAPVVTEARLDATTELLALSPEGRWLVAAELPQFVAPGRGRVLVFDLASSPRSPTRHELPLPDRIVAPGGAVLAHRWGEHRFLWRDRDRADVLLPGAAARDAGGEPAGGQSVLHLDLRDAPRFSDRAAVAGRVFYNDGETILFQGAASPGHALDRLDVPRATLERIEAPPGETILGAAARADGSIVVLLERSTKTSDQREQRLATLRPGALPPLAAALRTRLLLRRKPWSAPCGILLPAAHQVLIADWFRLDLVDLPSGAVRSLAGSAGIGNYPRLIGEFAGRLLTDPGATARTTGQVPNLLADESGAVFRYDFARLAATELIAGCRACAPR